MLLKWLRHKYLINDLFLKSWRFWPINASRFAPLAQVAMLDSWRSPHFVPSRTRCCTEGIFVILFFRSAALISQRLVLLQTAGKRGCKVLKRRSRTSYKWGVWTSGDLLCASTEVQWWLDCFSERKRNFCSTVRLFNPKMIIRLFGAFWTYSPAPTRITYFAPFQQENTLKITSLFFHNIPLDFIVHGTTLVELFLHICLHLVNLIFLLEFSIKAHTIDWENVTSLSPFRHCCPSLLCTYIYI